MPDPWKSPESRMPSQHLTFRALQAGPWQLVAEGLASMGNETGATSCAELSRPSHFEVSALKTEPFGARTSTTQAWCPRRVMPGAWSKGEMVLMEAKCIITQREVEQPPGREACSFGLRVAFFMPFSWGFGASKAVF